MSCNYCLHKIYFSYSIFIASENWKSPGLFWQIWNTWMGPLCTSEHSRRRNGISYKLVTYSILEDHIICCDKFTVDKFPKWLHSTDFTARLIHMQSKRKLIEEYIVWFPQKDRIINYGISISRLLSIVVSRWGAVLQILGRQSID